MAEPEHVEQDDYESWTPEQQNELKSLLRSKGHFGPCSQCGNARSWKVNNAPVWTYLSALGQTDWAHGHAHLVCGNCGHALLVSLKVIGAGHLMDGFAP